MPFQYIEVWTSVASSAGLLIGGIATLCIALLGLTTWRKEFVGKRDTDFCEEVLEKLYQVERAIKYMRCPVSFQSESSPPEQLARDDAQEEAVNSPFLNVLWNRYNEHHEAFAALRALRYRFMARFGKEAGQPFQDLHELVNELFSAAGEYALLSSPDRWPKTPEGRENHKERLKELNLVFFRLSSNDEIDPKLSCIVERIESKCRKHIAR